MNCVITKELHINKSKNMLIYFNICKELNLSVLNFLSIALAIKLLGIDMLKPIKFKKIIIFQLFNIFILYKHIVIVIINTPNLIRNLSINSVVLTSKKNTSS